MARPINIKDGKRTCSFCKQEKLLSDFSKMGGKRNHLYDSMCRKCRVQYKKQRFEKMTDEQKRQKMDADNSRRKTESYRQREREQNKGLYQRITEEQKQLRRENVKRYSQTERAKERRRIVRRNLRLEFIQVYGGKCECCGETTTEFLTIEHVNGGGRQQRKTMNTERLLRKLKKDGWGKKPEYALLCFNCNQAKGAYGYCPHQKENKEIKHS